MIPISIQTFTETLPEHKALISETIKAYLDWQELLQTAMKWHCAVCDNPITDTDHSHIYSFHTCCKSHENEAFLFDIRKARIEYGNSSSAIERYLWNDMFFNETEKKAYMNPLWTLVKNRPSEYDIIKQTINVFKKWENFQKFNRCRVCYEPCEDLRFENPNHFNNCCTIHAEYIDNININQVRVDLGYEKPEIVEN